MFFVVLCILKFVLCSFHVFALYCYCGYTVGFTYGRCSTCAVSMPVLCSVSDSSHVCILSCSCCAVHCSVLIFRTLTVSALFMSILCSAVFMSRSCISCLYSVVFSLHVFCLWSPIFMSVHRGPLSSCLYSLVFYIHVCTPWSSIFMPVLRGLLSSCLYSVVFYLMSVLHGLLSNNCVCTGRVPDPTSLFLPTSFCM